MKIIGITGTSGSGKTTLSEILSKKEEIKVIDADNVVKEMSIPNTEYLNAIKEEFGEKYFFKDGNLNRKELANTIYSNNEARENLNKLTFKYVVEEIVKRINNINEKNTKIIVIDAPLLFESGLEKCCDYVVSLIADEELKINRICKRDKIDKETAKKRLKIQQNNSY